MPGNFAAGGRVHHVEVPGGTGKVFKVTLVSEKTNRKTRQVEPCYVTVTMFSGHGDRAQPGAYLMCFGTIDGREYNGRYYVELVCESVDVVSPGQAARPPAQPGRQAPPPNRAPAREPDPQNDWDDGSGIPF